ncbi:hypothetical protein ACFYN3_42010 [Streptomyces lavendulae]|uniref:hypothetical protein n=1 Tax=Streptomyces lavendulae TaxID=1914 RepID=UPI0036C3D4D9
MQKITRLRAARLGVLAVLPVICVVAACGGGGTSDEGVATAQSSPAKGGGKDKPEAVGQATVKKLQDAYVACMRKNGIKFPDFKPGEGIPKAEADSGFYDSNSRDGVSELGRKATEACQPAAKELGEAEDRRAQDPKAQAEAKRKFREYADCLREKGIKVNDPKDGGSLFDDAAKVLEDPKFKAADPVCRQKAYGDDGAQE